MKSRAVAAAFAAAVISAAAYAGSVRVASECLWRPEGAAPSPLRAGAKSAPLKAAPRAARSDALLFSAQGLPAGISINSRTGEISGIVRGEQSGTAVITVKSKETGFSDTCSLAYDFAAQPEWSVGKYAAHVIDDASGETAGDIQLSSAASGAISGRIKAGKKTVASASSQLVLRDYVPGEGWTCELPLSIPKAGIVQVLEFRIEDTY